MDTLRLLSRSSGLKIGKPSPRDTQPIPSEGANENLHQHTDLNNKKRKREDVEQDVQPTALSEQEIRSVQKQHKIRITDLHALHDDNTGETRKVQKESSRLFPQPLQSFSQLQHLGLSKGLLSSIADQAYKEPTEVQLATIPLLIRNGSEEPDLLTVAPTGSGKTLAFLIPLINKISKANKKAENEDRHVSALILAPTKELVSQIVNEGRKLMARSGVKITELRKGMRLHTVDEIAEIQQSDDDDEDDDEEELDDLKTSRRSIIVKADILVSTPLSLVNSVTPKSGSAPLPLPQVRTLILDEADVLLDPLFREQTLSIWKSCVSPQLRTSLWSATIGSSIEELAISTIQSHHQSYNPRLQPQPPLIRTIIGLKDTSLPSITHKLVYASTETGKLMGVRQLLHPASSSSSVNRSKGSKQQQSTQTPILRPPFLIFTQTIPRAQSLHTELQYDIPASAGGSSRIAVLHSSLTTKQRTETMTSFRQGKIWILITTDLLSRGIDFRGVNGVVNYDIPTTSAAYVHRAGRTGRAGREGGICVTFYTKEDVEYLRPIAAVISASEKKQQQKTKDSDGSGKSEIQSQLPPWLLPSLPYLSKPSRADLKTRGVDIRRAIKESDTDAERRQKLKNRIGTTSGYEKKTQDRKRGMVEASKRRSRTISTADEGDGEDDEDEWGGLDD